MKLKKLFVPAVFALIIAAILFVGCRTTDPPRITALPTVPGRIGKPMIRVPNLVKHVAQAQAIAQAQVRSQKPDAKALSLGNGNGGETIIIQSRSYGCVCSNDFSLCLIQYFPCETNQFESFDVPEDPTLGRWYSGTNVLAFYAEPGWTYVPEFLVGNDWLSFSYFNDIEVPGIYTITNLHYLEYGPAAIFRIARYQRPETFPPEPTEN